MPRPALFTLDELLDAAAALLAADGPAAVTMSAVARAAGAPSGSMYHRFPTRAALCGELWLRTEERFHAGFITALSGSADPQEHPQERCVAAARFTVRWCRDHPVEAQVLLTGADALGAAEWPDELTRRRKRLQRALRRKLADVSADPDLVNAAVIDIPYAVVRRHLIAGRPIPASADAIVEQCALALIPPG
jgi:AcrR family transcriptional regulator